MKSIIYKCSTGLRKTNGLAKVFERKICFDCKSN